MQGEQITVGEYLLLRLKQIGVDQAMTPGSATLRAR